jgi:c-di-GMP-binding flagellar brake protein YcgR
MAAAAGLGKMLRRGKRRQVHHRKTRKIEFCPTAITRGGFVLSGFLVDISAGGAKIRFKQNEAEKVAVGDEVNLEIKTPYGTSSCTAVILRRETIDNSDIVGVRFTALSPNEQDPIRMLIDSAFC